MFCNACPLGWCGGACGTDWCWVVGLAKLKPVFIGTEWVDGAQEWITITAALSCTPGIQGQTNKPSSEALCCFSLFCLTAGTEPGDRSVGVAEVHVSG